jgi:hypothetical protein
MVGMFGESAAHCIENMRPAANGGLTVDMENYYSRLALDIIGKACRFHPCIHERRHRWGISAMYLKQKTATLHTHNAACS